MARGGVFNEGAPGAPVYDFPRFSRAQPLLLGIVNGNSEKIDSTNAVPSFD